MAGFDHFTHLAPFYDQAIRFTTLKRLLELGEFSILDLVLDAGGGTGRVASALTPFVRKVIVADTIIGDFMKYLLSRFSRSIESIIVVPR